MRILDLGIALDAAAATRLSGFWQTLKWTTAAVFAWLSEHFDGRGPNALLEVYGLMIFLDYGTGVLASLIVGKCKSGIALKGIYKKLMGLLAVAFGHTVDLYLVTAVGQPHNNFFMSLICRMLIGYEAISIGENLAIAKIVLPPIVREVIGRITQPADGGVVLASPAPACRYPGPDPTVTPVCRYPGAAPARCETCPERTQTGDATKGGLTNE